MNDGMALKHYLMEVFEPTILFSLVAGLIGAAAAWHYGRFDLLTAALAILVVVIAQVAVNLIDDYVDYSSGLDREAVKTKFSGGSPLVTGKLIRHDYVLAIGMLAFFLALGIGAYLIYYNHALLPFAAVGALTVLLYTKYLSKVPLMSEPLTALNFALICLACFIAAGGPLGRLGLVAFPAAAVGLQVGITVIVNYLPDRDVDRKYGRRNMVVMLRSNRNAAALYLAFQAASFAALLSGVALGIIPPIALAALVTLPVVFAVACKILGYRKPKEFERVMANAAMAELAFMLILVIAFA